jgi:hypothetical protein
MGDADQTCATVQECATRRERCGEGKKRKEKALTRSAFSEDLPGGIRDFACFEI